MDTAGSDDADAVLSDVEGEDSVPIAIKSPSPDEISVDKFRELLVELDRERAARVAAENTKSELQVSFNRLKALAHEAIKKRDEYGRQKDEAIREKEELSRLNEKNTVELVEAVKVKEKVLNEREDIAKELSEAMKSRDLLKAEVEKSTHMLVSGMEKISGKVSNFKNFGATGLPRSQNYTTGMPAAAYGVIKRTNEIVEELLRVVEAATKSRNEAREQMEQRNYEIAIEVSQLEATISDLREDVEKKISLIENLEGRITEKDGKINETEKDSVEKIHYLENEAARLKDLAGEYDDRARKLESRMEAQRPILAEQLRFISKIHEQIYGVIKIVDATDHSGFSESLFLPQQTDVEENLQACLAGLESIYELSRAVVEKTRDVVDKNTSEVKSLNETVSLLVKEKEQIGSLLRSALPNKMTLKTSTSTNELFQAAENGLKKAGIDFKFSKLFAGGNVPHSQDKSDSLETDDEIYTLAGTLENIVKASQLEIIELQHSVEELRAESNMLKERLEAQSMELTDRMHRIEKLEEKERIANESVEGLMMDIAASEEEIIRWKVAAEQEAAAGRAVEQEFVARLSELKQELEEAKQTIAESEKKIGFKEETATAAMAARDAAEKSLRLADIRATRLRDRVEELSHQLEEIENREDTRRGRHGNRYVCWPWQWLGLDFVGSHVPEAQQQQSSNEMELSEPLL